MTDSTSSSPLPPEKGRIPPKAQEALSTWFSEQRIKSVDNIEATARQLITLSTSLIGLIFTITALGKVNLPSYTSNPMLIWLSIGAVIAFLLSLNVALSVIWPKTTNVDLTDPKDMANKFNLLLDYKQWLLTVSTIAFGFGMAFLTIAVVLALFLSLTA